MTLSKINFSKNYKTIRKIYIFLYIVLVMQRALGPMKAITPAKVDQLIFFVLSALGVTLIFYDLLCDKILFKTVNISWLCLFLISVSISSILSLKYGLMDNINSIILLTIEFFIFYAIDFSRSKEEIYKEMFQIEHLIMIIWFLATIVTLIMFLTQYYYFKDLPNNEFARMGVIENRLFGIFNDPNYAAVTALIMIVFSIKNFTKTTNKLVKTFYIINIVFEFIYIILSGSRTAEIAMGAAVIVGVFFAFRFMFKNKNMSRLKCFLLCLGYTLLVLITIFITYMLLKKCLAYLPPLFSKHNANTPLRPVSFRRSDVEDSTDISNLRFKIWGSALELFMSKPIFGVSVKHIVLYARDQFPLGFIAEKGYTGHSFYINVISCTGIVGSILIFGFIIKNLITIFKAIFSIKNKEQYFNILFSFIPIIILLCSGFFLNEIIFVNTLGAIIFWLYLGYTMYFINENNKITNKSIPYKIANKIIPSFLNQNKT